MLSKNNSIEKFMTNIENDDISLDVHLIISSDTNKNWVNQCVESIHVAIEEAGYPVKLYIVDGVEGHIGKARTKGFSFGNAPYVTSIDDDDYILPNAFSILYKSLQVKPDAIFTKEITLQNGKFCEGRQRHHLAVYRRELLIDYDKWPCFDSVAQRKVIEHMNVIDIKEPVYVHRIYPMSKARVLRRQYNELLDVARG